MFRSEKPQGETVVATKVLLLTIQPSRDITITRLAEKPPLSDEYVEFSEAEMEHFHISAEEMYELLIQLVDGIGDNALMPKPVLRMIVDRAFAP